MFALLPKCRGRSSGLITRSGQPLHRALSRRPAPARSAIHDGYNLARQGAWRGSCENLAMLAADGLDGSVRKSVAGGLVAKINEIAESWLATLVEDWIAVAVELLLRWHCNPITPALATHQPAVAQDQAGRRFNV